MQETPFVTDNPTAPAASSTPLASDPIPDPRSPDPGKPLLAATDLHKHYKLGGQDLHVLRGVDLAVHEREFLAILGRSGSGKSTLLHLLAGLDRPDAGLVTFGEQDIYALTGARLDDYRNRHVGLVFQQYHLLPELTALENVMISSMIRHGLFTWPGKRGKERDRARELLTRVGLGERQRHKPSKLSGGERQRVAIARALMNRPALLLADEPTGNLDSQTAGSILELLHELHAGGQTLVMVTHDEKVASAADRRVTLVRGELSDRVIE